MKNKFSNYCSDVYKRVFSPLTRKRMMALFVDYIVVWLPVFGLHLAIPGFLADENVRAVVLWLLLVLKDVFGRSLGRRLFGIEIISTAENKVLPKWKLAVRNLLLIFGVDAIIAALSGKRLLDHLLGLDVIEKK